METKMSYKSPLEAKDYWDMFIGKTTPIHDMAAHEEYEKAKTKHKDDGTRQFYYKNKRDPLNAMYINKTYGAIGDRNKRLNPIETFRMKNKKPKDDVLTRIVHI